MTLDSDRRSRRAFLALTTAVLSFSLLQTVVVPALPDLQEQFGSPPTVMSWVLSSFLLSSAVGTVILARLGDMFGRKPLLLISLGILAAGSLAAAFAGLVGVLIAARAVQGLGAATFPLSFALVREVFPRERVPVVIGTISAMFGIGFGVGLVVPGPIADTFGWRWIFGISAIVIGIAFLAAAAFLPGGGDRRPARVDLGGAVAVSVGLSALLLAIGQGRGWGPGRVIGLLALAVVAFAVFGRWELRAGSPLVDLRVLGRRPVLAANGAALIIGFAMYGAFTLVPQYVQTPADGGYGFGAGVTASGLYLLPMAITMLFGGPAAGRLGARYGFRAVLVSACGLGVLGFLTFVLAHRHGWGIAVGAGILGIGIGFAFSSMANVLVAVVEPHETAEATGVNTIVRTIGGALGAQTAAAIVTAETTGNGLPAESGYTAAFAVSAIAMAVAAALARTLPRDRPPSVGAAEPDPAGRGGAA